MIGKLDGKIPPGPLEQKWRNHKNNSRLVSPNNRRKFEIIVVGSGLAGGSAAATLGELGYRVKCFCYQDSPRRAHSIAAQGGINAAKNYQNDGDSVFRLFYDTIKGGDFRSRASMAGSSPIVPSAAPKFHGRFTPVDKPASSFCSALIRQCAGKSRSAR